MAKARCFREFCNQEATYALRDFGQPETPKYTYRGVWGWCGDHKPPAFHGHKLLAHRVINQGTDAESVMILVYTGTDYVTAWAEDLDAESWVLGHYHGNNQVAAEQDFIARANFASK